MAVSQANLDAKIETLNKLSGFTKATTHYGFNIAYGGVQVIMRGGSIRGEHDITQRGTKSEINNCLYGMIKAVENYKDRVALKKSK